MKIYLKIKPINDKTDIEVSVYHDRRTKSVAMTLQVGTSKIDQNFDSFAYMMFSDPRKTVDLKSISPDAVMSRFSQKKLDAIAHDVQLQINEKYGPAWDIIQTFLIEHNLELCNA